MTKCCASPRSRGLRRVSFRWRRWLWPSSSWCCGVAAGANQTIECYYRVIYVPRCRVLVRMLAATPELGRRVSGDGSGRTGPDLLGAACFLLPHCVAQRRGYPIKSGQESRACGRYSTPPLSTAAAAMRKWRFRPRNLANPARRTPPHPRPQSHCWVHRWVRGSKPLSPRRPRHPRTHAWPPRRRPNRPRRRRLRRSGRQLRGSP